MSRVVFLCNGASMPAPWQGVLEDAVQRLNHSGADADVNLHIEDLSNVLLGKMEGRAADLITIAAYAYAADQSVSRGGEADVYGKKWRRQIALGIPVSDPRFWKRKTVSAALMAALGFGSEDTWEFYFTKASGRQGKLTLELSREEIHGNPDSVVLLSGGADSLGATLHAITSGKHPLVISHRASPVANSRRHKLVRELRERYPKWTLPEVGALIHRRGKEASERTQRSRSFLFVSLASACAHQLDIRDVVLADNGVVSVNLPINRQFVGALATRSTHPKFIRLFNQLLGFVFPHPPLVQNPMWNQTRSEALQTLMETGNADLLDITISCSRPRGLPRAMPQCGYCSQCVDRRFGAIHAGLEEHDPGERYVVDIFTDELSEGEERTVAVSYLSFARKVEQLGDEDLFKEFPELFDSAGSEGEAYEFVEMLRRHASAILSAMSTMVSRHANALAAGSLPTHSLVCLAAEPEEGSSPDGTAIQTVDRLRVSEVRWSDLPPHPFSSGGCAAPAPGLPERDPRAQRSAHPGDDRIQQQSTE